MPLSDPQIAHWLVQDQTRTSELRKANILFIKLWSKAVTDLVYWLAPRISNLWDTYMHNNHCHRVTAHLQLNILLVLLLL